MIIKGKIEKTTYKEVDGPNGKRTRFALKLADGKDLWYGTFDKKVFDRMQEAVDAQAETTVTYTERNTGNVVFRDIVSLKFEEGEPVAEAEVPI